jgi:hypothetical protein
MSIYLFILLWCLLPTACYITLWANRKRIIRWAIRRHAGQAEHLITQALAQRLINPTDAAELREEFGG